MLTRKSSQSQPAAEGKAASMLDGILPEALDRRTFMKRSGMAAGAGAFASQLPFNLIGTADAKDEATRTRAEQYLAHLSTLEGALAA